MHSKEMATTIAIELGATKLIFFTEQNGIPDQTGVPISELSIDQISKPEYNQFDELQLARAACQQGVSRCHLLSYRNDGALLEELYTRDGAGTQIIRESYEQIRPANPADVPGIIELISPLEEEGVLVKRSPSLSDSMLQFDFLGIIKCDLGTQALKAIAPGSPFEFNAVDFNAPGIGIWGCRAPCCFIEGSANHTAIKVRSISASSKLTSLEQLRKSNSCLRKVSS